MRRLYRLSDAKGQKEVKMSPTAKRIIDAVVAAKESLKNVELPPEEYLTIRAAALSLSDLADDKHYGYWKEHFSKS